MIGIFASAILLVGCTTDNNESNDVRGSTKQDIRDLSAEERIEKRSVELKEQRKKAEVNTERREKEREDKSKQSSTFHPNAGNKDRETRVQEEPQDEEFHIKDIVYQLNSQYGELFDISYVIYYEEEIESGTKSMIQFLAIEEVGAIIIRNLVVLTIDPNRTETNTLEKKMELEAFETVLVQSSRMSIDKVADLHFVIMNPSHPNDVLFIALEGELQVGLEDWVEVLSTQIEN